MVFIYNRYLLQQLTIIKTGHTESYFVVYMQNFVKSTNVLYKFHWIFGYHLFANHQFDSFFILFNYSCFPLPVVDWSQIPEPNKTEELYKNHREHKNQDSATNNLHAQLSNGLNRGFVHFCAYESPLLFVPIHNYMLRK